VVKKKVAKKGGEIEMKSLENEPPCSRRGGKTFSKKTLFIWISPPFLIYNSYHYITDKSTQNYLKLTKNKVNLSKIY